MKENNGWYTGRGGGSLNRMVIIQPFHRSWIRLPFPHNLSATDLPFASRTGFKLFARRRIFREHDGECGKFVGEESTSRTYYILSYIYIYIG